MPVQALSPGEEAMALHLRANRVTFEREVCLIPGRKWRFDFVIPGPRIVIEVHGAIWQRGKHARGDGLERDYAKMNAAVKAGYFPLQYSTDQVISGLAIGDVLDIMQELS